jgi:xylan 1,4-beta-xylosidase
MFVRLITLSVAIFVVTLSGTSPTRAADSFPVSIRVDASAPIGKFEPVWRFFGADEPNYA